jgi:hypothetical protein
LSASRTDDTGSVLVNVEYFRGQRGTGVGFLRVLRSLLSVLIPPSAAYSVVIPSWIPIVSTLTTSLSKHIKKTLPSPNIITSFSLYGPVSLWAVAAFSVF